jgi:hypothetical protein
LGAAPGFPSGATAHYCVPLLAGAGIVGAGINGFGDVVGFGDVAPEPVVVAGLVVCVALPVVTGDGVLLAVLLLLLQPAITRKAMMTSTAAPATQPHIPPTASLRCVAGSFERGSL